MVSYQFRKKKGGVGLVNPEALRLTRIQGIWPKLRSRTHTKCEEPTGVTDGNPLWEEDLSRSMA